jgi:hypothetical protein
MIMSKQHFTRTHPFRTFQDESRKPNTSSSQVTRGVTQESVVDTRYLHQVLSEGPGLNVISLGFGNPSQKVHRVGVTQVEFEGGQDVFLG